ncbi:hypothetical protein BdWA1_000524 [Babesia duncani]|uniref:Uncharacterized protein n=1 Tax=Babesia duncani TaxID=323732 RepID=A0AAD9PN92_9APIC|nr:hypothetical protein BdWA1_000524 [Babesia duncani]
MRLVGILLAPKRYVPVIPYGVKNSRHYKESKRQQRIAMEEARKQREMKGMILDSKKTLMLSLRDNSGINWSRAKQILKHLEVHWRIPSGVSLETRERIQIIAQGIKAQK